MFGSQEDLPQAASDAAGTEDMVTKLDIFEALHEVLCGDKAAPEGPLEDAEEKVQEIYVKIRTLVVKLSTRSNRCHLNILKRHLALSFTCFGLPFARKKSQSQRLRSWW